jgi:hypothetical protein
MSERAIGIVKKLTNRGVNTSRGPGFVTDIELSTGELISTFKPGNLKEGDRAEIEYALNGSYKNAVNIIILPPNLTQSVSVQTQLPVELDVKVQPVDVGSAVKEATRVCVQLYGKDWKDHIEEDAKFLISKLYSLQQIYNKK